MNRDSKKTEGASKEGSNSALRVALFFVAFSMLWIYVTDNLVARMAQSVLWIQNLQSMKAIAYIAIVGCLIYFISLKGYRQMALYHQRETESALDLLWRLSMAMEARDNASASHSDRICRLVDTVSRAYGMDDHEAWIVARASLLHDLGKIGIPDRILRKSGPLSDEERRQIEQHVTLGASLLQNSHHPLVQMGSRIILSHHENWDGTGSPKGLKGAEIPAEGRIVAVCDVFDALLSDRPYKDPWSFDDAVNEIKSLAGTKFDPQVVAAFEQAIPELREIAAADDASRRLC
ncbi:MAG TPA: HD domain-containing phosphohydrolase [Fimbriimonas sp.]